MPSADKGLYVAYALGALVAVLGAYYLDSAGAALVCAALAAAVLAAVHAVVVVGFGADQIVSGTAINIGSLGLTSLMIRIVFGLQEQKREVPHLAPVAVPVLSGLPVVGPILFNHVSLVYLAFVLVPLLSWLLYRTTWGLRILACGEHPRAADTSGVNVHAVRVAAVVACGLLAGLGGAFLSLGQLHFFVDDMIGGRGFIALAALISGRWDPMRTLIACLLFGAADALQFRMQAFGIAIPHQFMLMFPYVATLAALLVFTGRSRQPAALGLPYRAEGG